MDLYILRHGRAGTRGPEYPDDSKRPLTQDGRARIGAIAKAMETLGVHYDRALTSPFTRALETAEIVTRAHGTSRSLVEVDELGQGRGPEGALRAIRRDHAEHESLLVVGHEPDLGELVSRLATGANDGLRITLKKGGLVKLVLPSLAPRARATIEWVLTPRHMMRMR